VVRIIAGVCKGRRLETLPGSEVRPTADRAKESLFSILGSRVVGARFLDLFAGCGSVGLEAASRGAGEVVLVEVHAAVLRALERNVQSCGVEPVPRIVPAAVSTALERLSAEGKVFDLIFLDPPYTDRAAYREIERLPALLAFGGRVVVQHDRRVEPHPVRGLELIRCHRVGRTMFSFYGAAHAGEGGGLPRDI